jgi:single stranded DNA-binding protein
MSREHVSKAEVLGHLGQDPEVGYTDKDVPFVRLSVATSERFTDRDGAIRERTDWHRATAWGPLAEQIARAHLTKGDRVVLAGTLRINSYTAHDLQHRVNEIEVETARKALAEDLPRNEARLVGVVREEPKTRRLENGAVLTTISMATKVMVNGKEREDWHSLVAWGKTAEAAARQIKVGHTLSVNGPVRHRSVTVEGGERQMSSIEISKFQVLDLQRQRGRGQGLSL